MSVDKYLNKNVLIGVAVVLGGAVLLRPSLIGPVLLLVLVAACPLSMLLMMKMDAQGRPTPHPPAGLDDAGWPADMRTVDRPPDWSPHPRGREEKR